MKHIAGSDEENTACGSARVWDAEAAGELTDDPAQVSCPKCVAVLQQDGVLLERGVEA